VAHRRAKLTVLDRRLLVDRILVDGMAVAHAADMAGISRQAAWKWLRRFETEGESGLEDRTSRRHRMPRSLPRDRVEAILAARHEHRFGPHRLAPILGVPRSTIGDALERHGFARLADQD
jgi:transposase